MNKGVFWGSVFFSLSLSEVIRNILSKSYHLNFFLNNPSNPIPKFSNNLAEIKTLDIVGYSVFVLICLILLGVNKYISNTRKSYPSVFGFVYLAVSIALFLQVNFVGYSGKLILLFTGVFHLIFWLLPYLKTHSFKFNLNIYRILNGLLLSFLIVQIVQKYNYSLIIPFFIVIITPVVYCCFTSEIFSSPFHLLLSLFIFRPGDINFIILLIFITAAVIVIYEIFNFKFSPKILKAIQKIYPLIFITIISFNPLYFWSHLDTVEEGFWLGWVQRLLSGQILYKDVLVYHPPILIWLLKIFVSIFGISVANVKLFFHILQIIAYIIFYVFIKNTIKSKYGQLLCLLMLMSISPNLVKNNFEIRLAMGLLPIIPITYYLEKNKKIFLILSGFLTGVALMTSLDIGIVILLALILSFILIDKFRSLNILFSILLGLIIFFVPLSLFLLKQGSLFAMFNELSFYAKSFSEGYFNIPAPTMELSPLLDWRLVYKYLGTDQMWWQFTEIIIVASLGMGLYQINFKRKGVNNNHLILILSLFGLFLFRTALGRSDLYHILFPTVPALILFFILIEKQSFKPTHYYVVSLLLFVFYLNPTAFNQNFLHDQIQKFQSYGRIPGRAKVYLEPRYGISVNQGADTNSSDSLISYLKTYPHEQKIFAFPWMPEIYFLSNRQNATSLDTPYAFYSNYYQQLTIDQLGNDLGTLIIYNPNFALGGLTSSSLDNLNSYILQNYYSIKTIGEVSILKHN